MMLNMLPKRLQSLMESLRRLPGIGPKSAERLVAFLLKSEPAFIQKLTDDLLGLKGSVNHCQRCQGYSNALLCELCSGLDRDQRLLCIVEEPFDVMVMENTGAYRGLYHVLHGALSPAEGITAEHLKINELLSRLQEEPIEEMIFATNPTLMGEATAYYIAERVPRGIRVTHLAQGIPLGGHLEFLDRETLRRAFKDRRERHAS